VLGEWEGTHHPAHRARLYPHPRLQALPKPNQLRQDPNPLFSKFIDKGPAKVMLGLWGSGGMKRDGGWFTGWAESLAPVALSPEREARVAAPGARPVAVTFGWSTPSTLTASHWWHPA
jgi:hypothetical protein